MDILGKKIEMLDDLGVSIYGDKSAIGHDFTDAVASIEDCGDGVLELVLNTNDGFKIRINGDIFQFQNIAIALIQAAA